MWVFFALAVAEEGVSGGAPVAPPAPPMTVEVPVAVTLIAPGHGPKRRLAWQAVAGDAWEAQLARRTVVDAFEGEPLVDREMITTVSVAVPDPASAQVVVSSVEAVGYDLLASVQLSEAGRAWSEHPWTVTWGGAHPRVDLGVDAALDVGIEEVALGVLEALQLVWLPLPATPVGRGAVWDVHLEPSDGVALTARCTLEAWSRRLSLVRLEISGSSPEEASLTTTGRIWIDPRRPLPAAAELKVEVRVGEGEEAVSGTETVTWTSR